MVNCCDFAIGLAISPTATSPDTLFTPTTTVRGMSMCRPADDLTRPMTPVTRRRSRIRPMSRIFDFGSFTTRPFWVAIVRPARDRHTQDHAVVDLVALPQRSLSPPSIPASRNSRWVVQPLSDRETTNGVRCVSPQHSRSGPKLASACRSELRKPATES